MKRPKGTRPDSASEKNEDRDAKHIRRFGGGARIIVREPTQREIDLVKAVFERNRRRMRAAHPA